MTPQEYVIAATHYMTERDGAPPEQPAITLELATRCLDMLERIRTEEEHRRKLMEQVHELMHKLGRLGAL